jgi:nucleotide-binding universal stress UspA family protein
MVNDATRATSADQSEQEHLIPLAALMVHVDVEHDSEQRVELAISLADRFRPFLQQAKEVLIVEIGENESHSQAKKNLADVAAYLVRHQVIVAAEVWRRPRGPVAAELLHVVEEEKADLIVAGGYGHSRLGEWIFGGVTRELLTASPVCCMLSH